MVNLSFYKERIPAFTPGVNPTTPLQSTGDSDEMGAYLNDALELSFLHSGPHGIFIPNGQSTHREVANWLRENTELHTYQIKATLSRLPPEWPDS